MSVANANLFIEASKNDTELQAKLSDLEGRTREESLDRAVAIGMDAGYSFSASNLSEAMSGELSDAELEIVAGGANYSIAATAYLGTVCMTFC